MYSYTDMYKCYNSLHLDHLPEVLVGIHVCNYDFIRENGRNFSVMLSVSIV